MKWLEVGAAVAGMFAWVLVGPLAVALLSGWLGDGVVWAWKRLRRAGG